jgi:hypothetical protein
MAISRATVQPVNPVLTQFAIDYTNAEFIGDKIFPKVSVGLESGTYYLFSGKDRFTVPPAMQRAPGALFQRGTWSVSSGTYTCQEDAEEIPVDKRLQKTALAPLDPFRDASEIAASHVLLRREKRILDAITNTTTFTSYTTAVAAADRWDDPGSDPIQYIQTIMGTIRTNCGSLPNTFVIPLNVWFYLMNHDVVIDRLKNTDDKIVTEAIFAKLIGIENILIAKAVYNSAEEGQTVSLAETMGKYAFLAYVEKRPALMRPSVGYIIESSGFQVENYYENQSDSDIVRARNCYTLEFTALDCGYLLSTVIS